jgi:hypothetical protein
VVWKLFGSLAAGATYLVGRNAARRAHQAAAARAAGLQPVPDLLHLPEALQRTALWSLADGGFERRVARGTLARPDGDVELNAFDLETLRERRGEWARLPVEPPFRIGGLVSVVTCTVARRFPHILLKRGGRGDELLDDTRLERLGNLAAQVRARLGIKRSYEAELPPTLPDHAYAAAGLPEHWRAYTRAGDLLDRLLAAGLDRALVAASRRDLVVELLEGLLVIYPAARDVVGPDAYADLTTTALDIVDGVLAASRDLSRL